MEESYILVNVVIAINVIILIKSDNKNAFMWFCIRMAIIATGYCLYFLYLKD